MIRVTKTILVLIAISMCMFSCSKNEIGSGDTGDTGQITGRLLYTFSGRVIQLDLTSNRATDFFMYNTYGFGDWSLSQDNEYRIISEREAGEFRATKFSLIKNSDHTQVAELDYYNPIGNATGVTGYLSPDNTKILVQPTNESGVVIADLKGEHLHHLQDIDIGGSTRLISATDEALWLPDHSILLMVDGEYIVKLSPPYETVSLICHIPDSESAKLAVDRAGKQAAIWSNGHIWVMNISDGVLRRVTENAWSGLSAQFSPDGEYLVVAKKFDDVGRFNLAIVPNDGYEYDLDDSEEVWMIQPDGENILATVNGSYYWIP